MTFPLYLVLLVAIVGVRHKYLGEITIVAGSGRVYSLLSRYLVLLIVGFLSPRILKQFINSGFN